MDYENEIQPIIDKILLDPKNLATPLELEQQTKACQAALARADRDGNKIITEDEIGTLCEILGLPLQDSDREDRLSYLDKDSSGSLELIEFLEWWLQRISQLPGNKKQQEMLAKNLFQQFDQDHSGSIDSKEFNQLIQSLGIQLTTQELIEAIQELDLDDSGYIEQEEFIHWWSKRTEKVRKGGGLISYKLKRILNKAMQMYETDLFTAVWSSQISLIHLFLESQPNLILSLDQSEFGNNWSILHYAVYQKNVDMVKYFLTLPLVNVNIRNGDGFTPLFYAAQQNHKELCQLLLDAGADPSIAGQDLMSYPDIPPMCPVDHLIDSPDLADLFLSHEKCIKPHQQPNLSMAKLSVDGFLSFEITNYPQISHLPIQKWDLSFHLSEAVAEGRGEDSAVLSFQIKQFQLKTEHRGIDSVTAVTCQPPVKNLEKLMKAIAGVPPKERNGALEIEILAVNAIGAGEEPSERCSLDLSEIVG